MLFLLYLVLIFNFHMNFLKVRKLSTYTKLNAHILSNISDEKIIIKNCLILLILKSFGQWTHTPHQKHILQFSEIRQLFILYNFSPKILVRVRGSSILIYILNFRTVLILPHHKFEMNFWTLFYSTVQQLRPSIPHLL